MTHESSKHTKRFITRTEQPPWHPMGKSISNIYRYAEISKASNKRYLNALNNIIPKGKIEKEINRICEKTVVNGRQYTGFNVWKNDTFQLFTELSSASYIIRGFTNKDIRNAFWDKKEADIKANRNRMTRTFAKLRAHGLIKKIPHSLRYNVTDNGRRVMGVLIETRNRHFPKLAS